MLAGSRRKGGKQRNFVIPRNRDRAGEGFTIQTGIGRFGGEVAVRPHIQHPGGGLFPVGESTGIGRARVGRHLGIGKDSPVRKSHGDAAARGRVGHLQQHRYHLAGGHSRFVRLDGKQRFVKIAAGWGFVVIVQHRKAKPGGGGGGFGGGCRFFRACSALGRSSLACRLRGQHSAAAGQQAEGRQQRSGQPSPALSFGFAIHKQTPLV